MDNFGESPSIYVWPAGHEPGNPYPEDFWANVETALDAAGIAWERVS